MEVIYDQTSLDQLLNLIDDDDTFIRESHFKSYSYSEKNSIVAPGAFGDLRVFLICNTSELFGVDLLFTSVSEYMMSFEYDIQPKGYLKSSGVDFFFHGSLGRVVCKSISFKVLTEEIHGDVLLYN